MDRDREDMDIQEHNISVHKDILRNLLGDACMEIAVLVGMDTLSGMMVKVRMLVILVRSDLLAVALVELALVGQVAVLVLFVVEIVEISPSLYQNFGYDCVCE